MSKLTKTFRVLPLWVLCLLVVSGTAGAVTFAHRQLAVVTTAKPEVKVMLAGAVERESGLVALDKASAVNPGDVLRWHITSLNEGSAAAREYKAVGHIPKGTSLIEGTAIAEGGSTVTYSIDNGQTFSAQPIVEEKQPDGTVKRRPAPVSMYTEVRYEWSDELAAGGKLSASYKVRVK